MDYEIVEIPLKIKPIDVTKEKLNFKRAIDFCLAIDQSDYARLKRVQKSGNDEIITFEVDIPIGQGKKVDIRYCEVCSALFTSNNSTIPTVFVLRKNFPSVPHINLMSFEYPRCLCLYEESHHELQLRLTPQVFLKDIKNWFYRTAYNMLHQDDQSLEPFLQENTGRLFFPYDIKENEDVNVYLVSEKEGIFNFLAIREKLNSDYFKEVKHHVLIIQSRPIVHGIIRSTPKNLFELSSLLQKIDIDLFDLLDEKLDDKVLDFSAEHFLIILLNIPLLRSENDKNSVDSYYAFISTNTLEQICKKLNLRDTHIDEKGQKKFGKIIGTIKDFSESSNLPIGFLIPYKLFNKQQSRIYNNIANEVWWRGEINLFHMPCFLLIISYN
jgi:hypothetical protein